MRIAYLLLKLILESKSERKIEGNEGELIRSIFSKDAMSPEMLQFTIRESQGCNSPGTLCNLESVIRECNGSRMIRSWFRKVVPRM